MNEVTRADRELAAVALCEVGTLVTAWVITGIRKGLFNEDLERVAFAIAQARSASTERRWRYQRNADRTESQIRLADDVQEVLNRDTDGKPWAVDLVFEAPTFEAAKLLIEQVLENLYESLEDRKTKELAKLGEAVLHHALDKCSPSHATSEQYADELAQLLDGPFEDVQPTPLFLALVRDWLEMKE